MRKIVTCEECGKKIKEINASIYHGSRYHSKAYFCSDECYEKFMDEVMD